MRSLEGKVAIITGAGHGLGRAYAELFAREGSKVVVNDLGVNPSGAAEERGRAQTTVDLIRAAGGEAVAHNGDCADWSEAKNLVDLAVETFGRLDVLVNNAGVLRDRMIFHMSEEDWDVVTRVNLKGHFCPTRHACAHWRERAKTGERFAGRIINTTSLAGIFGNAGQTNYAAAKAGIVGFTLALAREVERYGVTANVVAPLAQTGPEMAIAGLPDEVRALLRVEHVAPLVAFLASDRAARLNGQVFQAAGGRIDRFDGWSLIDGAFKGGEPWTVAELARVFDDRVAGRDLELPHAIMARVLAPIVEAASKGTEIPS